jgi:hypothetical protein
MKFLTTKTWKKRAKKLKKIQRQRFLEKRYQIDISKNRNGNCKTENLVRNAFNKIKGRLEKECRVGVVLKGFKQMGP